MEVSGNSMNIKITTRHIPDRKTTNKVKTYMLSKLPRLERYLHKRGEEASVRAILSSEKLRHTAEVIVVGTRLSATASVTSEDMSSSIDNVMDAVVKQLRRKGDKKISSRRKMSAAQTEETGKPAPQVEIRRVAVKPMSPEEAALQVRVADSGFIAFVNSETQEMNVVYREDDKTVLIVP